MNEFKLGEGQLFDDGKLLPEVTAADLLTFATHDPRVGRADFIGQTVLAACDDLVTICLSLEGNGQDIEARMLMRIYNRLATCTAIQERMDRAQLNSEPQVSALTLRRARKAGA